MSSHTYILAFRVHHDLTTATYDVQRFINLLVQLRFPNTVHQLLGYPPWDNLEDDGFIQTHPDVTINIDGIPFMVSAEIYGYAVETHEVPSVGYALVMETADLETLDPYCYGQYQDRAQAALWSLIAMTAQYFDDMPICLVELGATYYTRKIMQGARDIPWDFDVLVLPSSYWLDVPPNNSAYAVVKTPGGQIFTKKSTNLIPPEYLTNAAPPPPTSPVR